LLPLLELFRCFTGVVATGLLDTGAAVLLLVVVVVVTVADEPDGPLA
jgi:hypothetical protein